MSDHTHTDSNGEPGYDSTDRVAGLGDSATGGMYSSDAAKVNSTQAQTHRAPVQSRLRLDRATTARHIKQMVCPVNTRCNAQRLVLTRPSLGALSASDGPSNVSPVLSKPAV